MRHVTVVDPQTQTQTTARSSVIYLGNILGLSFFDVSVFMQTTKKYRPAVQAMAPQFFSLTRKPTSPLILYIIKTRSKIPSKAKRREPTQSQLNKRRNCMTNNKTDKAVVSINQATTRCIRPCQEIRGCDGGWGGGYHPPLSA